MSETAGPNYAGAGADDSSVGTLTWSNPGRIVADDNSRADVTGIGGQVSHYLKGTTFAMSIPTGATIDGIQLDIGRYSQANSTNYAQDLVVKSVKGGVVGGTNLADTVSKWPTSETMKTYGGTSELWGQTWTAEEVNDSTFGFVLSIGSYGYWNTAYVDYFQCTVTYTAGGGATQYNQAVIGTITPAGVAVKGVSAISYAGTLTTVGALAGVKAAIKSLVGTLTTAGDLRGFASKQVSGSVATAGALGIIQTLMRSFSGTVDTAGSMVRQAAKKLEGMMW